MEFIFEGVRLTVGSAVNVSEGDSLWISEGDAVGLIDAASDRLPERLFVSVWGSEPVSVLESDGCTEGVTDEVTASEGVRDGVLVVLLLRDGDVEDVVSSVVDDVNDSVRELEFVDVIGVDTVDESEEVDDDVFVKSIELVILSSLDRDRVGEIELDAVCDWLRLSLELDRDVSVADTDSDAVPGRLCDPDTVVVRTIEEDGEIDVVRLPGMLPDAETLTERDGELVLVLSTDIDRVMDCVEDNELEVLRGIDEDEVILTVRLPLVDAVEDFEAERAIDTVTDLDSNAVADEDEVMDSEGVFVVVDIAVLLLESVGDALKLVLTDDEVVGLSLTLRVVVPVSDALGA